MSELEQFLDTSSPRFECVDDPPQSPCPMEDKSKDPIINSTTGERVCPLCYISLGFPVEQSDSFFDDDEESMESESDVEFTYIAEGDRIQETTTEQKRINDRKESFRKSLRVMSQYDLDFAIFASNENNIDTAMSRLESLEKSEEPLFIKTRSVLLKTVAVLSHMRKEGMPNQTCIKALGLKSQNLYRLTRHLEVLDRPDIESGVSREIDFISKIVDVPSAVATQAIESYERLRPANSVISETVRAAAWLFLTAKASGVKVYKKDFYALPNVSREAFNKSLTTYEEQGNAYIEEIVSGEL